MNNMTVQSDGDKANEQIDLRELNARRLAGVLSAVAFILLVLSFPAVAIIRLIPGLTAVPIDEAFSGYTALLTAIAFVFAVVTFTTELRKMREDAKAQRESAKLQSLAAAVGPLTMLADWQYKMMMQDSVELQNAHRDKCQEFARRALSIVNELSPEGSQSSEVVILSPLDVFERRLKNLRNMVLQTREFSNKQSNDDLVSQLKLLTEFLRSEYEAILKIDAEMNLAVVRESTDFNSRTETLRNSFETNQDRFRDITKRMLDWCNETINRLLEVASGSRICNS